MSKTRLIPHMIFDNQDDIPEAGSNEEYDLLYEWDRSRLVEKIVELDSALEGYSSSRVIYENNKTLAKAVEKISSALYELTKKVEGEAVRPKGAPRV